MSRKIFTFFFFCSNEQRHHVFLPKATKSGLKYVLGWKELFIRRSKSCNFCTPRCAKPASFLKPDVFRSKSVARCISSTPILSKLTKRAQARVPHRTIYNPSTLQRQGTIENQIVSVQLLVGTVRAGNASRVYRQLTKFSFFVAGKNRRESFCRLKCQRSFKNGEILSIWKNVDIR